MINLARTFRFVTAITLALAPLTLMAAPVVKDYSLKLSKPGEAVTLDVEIRFGSIVVEGYDGKTVEVQATFKDINKDDLSDSDDYEMIERIERSIGRVGPKNKDKVKPRSSKGLKRVVNNSVHLNITEDENEVDIESETHTKFIDLYIKVPKTSSVEAEVYAGGDVTVKFLSGSLELGNHRGGINAIQIDGPIVAETWRSDIVVEFASFDKANPSSFTTHLGNVDITVPEKKIKANILVQSYRGEILSGLNTEFVPSDEVKNEGRGRQEITLGGAMVAKLNGGGQNMSAQTYSGNIYIRQK